MAATCDIKPRHEAVRDIANALADRTHFVLTIPPTTAPYLHEALNLIPTWTVYLDTGTDAICVLGGDTRAVYAATALHRMTSAPIVAVVLVPKTVPAKRLGRALKQHIPADGSQDLIVVQDPNGATTCWPAIFVDALAQVDPAAAAQLHAAAVTR